MVGSLLSDKSARLYLCAIDVRCPLPDTEKPRSANQQAYGTDCRRMTSGVPDPGVGSSPRETGAPGSLPALAGSEADNAKRPTGRFQRSNVPQIRDSQIVV